MLTSRYLLWFDADLLRRIGVVLLVIAAAGVALLPAPLNAAAVVGLITVLVTLARPLWGLYLVMLSVGVQDVGALEIGGIAITATKLIVPLALAAWLLLRLTAGGLQPARARLTGAYALFVVAMLGSVVTAIDQEAALTEAARWIQAFGIFFMTLDLVRTRRALLGLTAVLLLGGGLQALLGLVQTAVGAGPESFALTDGASRAFGTFGMPNSYAGYLEMSLPMAIALCAWLLRRVVGRNALERYGRLRPWWLLAPAGAVVLLLGIVASFSRGAWLGTLSGLGAMVVLAGRRTLATATVVAVIAASVLIAGGTALLPAEITQRFGSAFESLAIQDVRRMVITPENYAVAERLAMWQAGLSMFDAQPIFGVGIGNYNVAYPHYRVPQFVYSRGHAHNYYIHVAAEMGLIGLIAYGLVLVAAWVDIGRALVRVRDHQLRALVVGAAGVLAAVMVHNIFENLHVLNMNLHLFAMLAIPPLALRIQAREEATP